MTSNLLPLLHSAAQDERLWAEVKRFVFETELKKMGEKPEQAPEPRAEVAPRASTGNKGRKRALEDDRIPCFGSEPFYSFHLWETEDIQESLADLRPGMYRMPSVAMTIRCLRMVDEAEDELKKRGLDPFAPFTLPVKKTRRRSTQEQSPGSK